MELNEKETALVELLADLSDGRTREDKAAAAGFHPKSIYRLLRRPGFREAITTRVRENLGVDLTRVFAVLVEAAISGNIKAAELLLKAAGYISTGAQQTNVVNVAQQREADNQGFAARLRDHFDERKEQYRRTGGPKGITRLEGDEDDGC